MAAGELWLEAERGDRGDGAHAAQDGVAKLEERVVERVKEPQRCPRNERSTSPSSVDMPIVCFLSDN